MNEKATLAQPMKKKVVIRKLFRFACAERGSALIEFAVTVMMLMSVTLGVFGFALAMYSYQFVSSAAQQGVRFAVVRGYTWSKDVADNCSTSAPPSFRMPYNCTASGADIQNYVQNLGVAGINQSGVTINTNNSYIWPGQTPSGSTTPCSTTNSQGCIVKVTVSYTFKFFGIQHLSPLAVSATSQGVILQ
jgi:Flp pilus assembly protein TadG